jgi:hypothetical protein
MDGRNEGMKWFWIGLAGMFIPIGAAVLFSAVSGKAPASQPISMGTGWIGNVA